MLVFSLVLAAVLASSASSVESDIHDGLSETAMAALHMGTPPQSQAVIPSMAAYNAALKALDIDAVKADLMALFWDSQDWWPADWGHYGPFFVRLAWHCSGTYRASDGVGGCGGARQRFEPEASWEDNTNLDKARALLAPIKMKYGDALSWGDLFIAAGTTALRASGAPIKQLCFGRVDEVDGKESLPLGPSSEQKKVAPCEVNGMCKGPLGATTVGLIYVNPEGPVMEKGGKPVPDPALSVHEIRRTFELMGHSDRGTVALIGGGHAIGKAHGACPRGAGPSPKEAYSTTPTGTPWPGLCGTGKGKDTSTSGIEGPWTTRPLRWDNEFFKVMLENEWEKHIGPGGHWQWRISNATGPLAGLMRMTSDLALLQDEEYFRIVEEFAGDMTAFDDAFNDAWFKLTTVNGNGKWAEEAKCDKGNFAEAMGLTGMLTNDIVIP